MERRLADEPEWLLQTQLAMIRDAGFDGAGVRFIDPAFATDMTGFLRAHGLIWQAQCYPKCVWPVDDTNHAPVLRRHSPFSASSAHRPMPSPAPTAASFPTAGRRRL